MDKYIDGKIQALVKSMYKSVQKIKENAVKDVLDGNRVAEMSDDSLPGDKSGILSKNKEMKKEKMKKEMKKDFSNILGLGGSSTSAQNPNSNVSQGGTNKPAEGTSIADKIGFGKHETFVKDTMKNFDKISKAYIYKMNKKES